MLQLNGQPLTLQQIFAVANRREQVSLYTAARERVDAARSVVERIVDE